MKKVLKILTLIMLIITLIKIGDTYAKYFATANTATLTKEVGKWVVKINNMDIYSESGETVEFNLLETFGGFSNTYSSQDKISPSSTGYIDIIIDPTDTDVAVRYDVELDLTGVSNLAIQARLEMPSGEDTLVKTGPHTYSGTLSIADIQAGKKAVTRCYITWDNDENNNQLDSITGSYTDLTLNLDANVTVSQYFGEELTPYVEPTI